MNGEGKNGTIQYIVIWKVDTYSMGNSIMGFLRGLARRSPLFRRVGRKIRSEVNKTRYDLNNKGIATDEKSVFFTSFAGRNYADSPKAIYEYLVGNQDFSDYRFYWAFNNPEKYMYLKGNPNTEVIKTGSKEENEAIGKSKFWITNYRMLDHFVPRDDQVYVQCWHGTPLKKLGYDLKQSDNAMNEIEEIYDKYRKDALRFKYMISPSRWATEAFASAWNLKEFGEKVEIIEEGYPRNDRLANYTQEEVGALKEKLSLKGDKKVLLYTPTWRDNQFDKGKGYVYSIGIDFDKLQKELEEEWVILFRTHYLVANSFDFEKYEGFILDVSDYDDINDLYLVSDLLITDYSSTFFDFANLRRPILFFMYDKEEYEDKLRGFYLDLSELPGKVLRREEDLLKEIELLGDWKPNEVYNSFNAKFNYLDDGKATERVVKRVFVKE